MEQVIAQLKRHAIPSLILHWLPDAETQRPGLHTLYSLLPLLHKHDHDRGMQSYWGSVRDSLVPSSHSVRL